MTNLLFALNCHYAYSQNKIAILVIGRSGADDNIAVKIERDLRNMYSYAYSNKEYQNVPKLIELEPRFDVGYISKGELDKSKIHFNQAQRALENNDHEEATEQLFRAQRFYNKAIPYASDQSLLRGIFFYNYLADLMSKNEKKANESYCEYVTLSRNLAGSVGSIDQFEPLADKCGKTSISGTSEIKVTSNIDGAHVYIDDRGVGVIGKKIPYGDPFISAGPHLIEVRKAGFVRWGKLITLKTGKSINLEAGLKKAKNRNTDFNPLMNLIFEGKDASSETYIGELMFQMAEKFGVNELLVGYLELKGRKNNLSILYYGDYGFEKTSYSFPVGNEYHYNSLSSFWKSKFKKTLNPIDAIPEIDSWAPTLFKVE